MFDKNNLPKASPQFYKDYNDHKEKLLEEYSNQVISKVEYDKKIEELEEIKKLVLEQKMITMHKNNTEKRNLEKINKENNQNIIVYSPKSYNKENIVDTNPTILELTRESTGVPMYEICCEHCGKALYLSPIKLIMGGVRFSACDFVIASSDVNPIQAGRKPKCPDCDRVTDLCLGKINL